MRRDARMLAAPLGRSMGLGEAWEVSETWFEEVEGGPDELHVRVARRRGHAVPCPECGVPCGVHDARERTWRHLDIWQFRTYVHCAVPRTDCPEHGVRTVLMPWEVRPNSHFTALFEAQVLAACMRGSTVKAVAEALGEDDRRLWDMLGRAVAQARGSADYSDAGRVGHRRDQPLEGPHLHIHHARPRRQEVRRRDRRKRQGVRGPHVRPARGPRRRQGGDHRGHP